MTATLSIITNTLAYSDPGLTAPANDPKKKNVDWTSCLSLTVSNPSSVPYSVAPGSSLTVFDGSRSISADNTTVWTLAISILATNRYRFTATSGTAPVLRTARTVTLTSSVLTITSNANQTLTVASSTAAFGSVVTGDNVFIPGPVTGDATSVFDPLNQGLWIVISNDNSNLQLARPSGVSYTGASGVVTNPAATAFTVFSSAGVQIGDGVYINSGFSSAVQRGYTVVAVTPTWFEVITTAPLPVSAVATPGATGLQFYSTAKRYVEMWADQECVLRLNGDTGDFNKVSPWQAGDILQAGHFAKAGLVWTATIVNKSTATLNVQFIMAE